MDDMGDPIATIKLKPSSTPDWTDTIPVPLPHTSLVKGSQ